MKKSGARLVTTIFLCHNCSDINSPSGEACRIVAFEGVDHERILHGANDCVMGYKRNVSDEEREEFAPLILPDEMSIETDFYKLQSEEARENLHTIMSKPLWELNTVIYYMSNEMQMWSQAEEAIYQAKRYMRYQKRQAEKLQDDIKKANAFFRYAVSCNQGMV